MMKIAILTNSASGLTNNSVPNLFVLPLPIIFPDNTIMEDNDNSNNQKTILTSIAQKNLTTSGLNPAILAHNMLTILETFDAVIFFPVAYNLSSEYENSLVLLNDDELQGKITIVKHYFTGIQLGQFILLLLKLIPSVTKVSDLQIATLVQQWETNSLLLVIPGDITILARSGRVNKLLVSVINKINLKVGIIWGHKPQKVIGKSYQTLIKKYLAASEKHLKLTSSLVPTAKTVFYLAHTNECDQSLIALCQSIFAHINIRLELVNLPTIFAVHGGINTLGLVTCRDISA